MLIKNTTMRTTVLFAWKYGPVFITKCQSSPDLGTQVTEKEETT
jgi:hypothetical protein